MVKAILTSFSILLTLLLAVSAANEQCGWQANDTLCDRGLCCSSAGFCGDGDPYCGDGCQSQCDGPVAALISRETFDEMLNHRNDSSCTGSAIYTYDAFISAAKHFPEFGNKAYDDEINKREIAAFLAQTSQQTTGAQPNATDQNEWGYCYVEALNQDSDYCNTTYDCCSGHKYYGRGPIQLTWNYNYINCGNELETPLLCNPELLATDPVFSFKSAIWFWMTPQPESLKPSCHEVITEEWTPTPEENDAGWKSGFGMTTYIVNSTECGSNGDPERVEARIKFFSRYCALLGVTTTGKNLNCFNYTKPNPPNGNGLMDLVESM